MEEIKYTQDWKAYNAAQCGEGEYFAKILHSLCKEIPNPKQKKGPGRKSLPISDMIFASALKVYSTFSLRRFVSIMRDAKQKDYIDDVCSYSTVSNYMRKEAMTPILKKLIQESSSPLASVETKFATDSSGFATSRFGRYYSFKHGRDLKYKKWIKAHISIGVKTNVVTSAEISKERSNDSPFFKPLIDKTAETFDIKEVYADKAYPSRENYSVVAGHGGTAYIPFKCNTTGKARGSMYWRKMYHYFMFNREEFMEHYHKRSNVETTFHMIKTKFRDNVRSKDEISQTNEILLKILCHNIVVLIHEMFELGIDPTFTRISN